MNRQVFRIVMLVVILGLAWLLKQPPSAPTQSGAPRDSETAAPIGPASKTWGHLASLPDHFARHGADFGARNAEDYAAQAAAFLARAKTEGLPAKRDPDGALRVYDPATGAFGAYNANGTTRTYFKPGSPTYFERQPGVNVDLRKER
jgi:pyocin large subunit-like protein